MSLRLFASAALLEQGWTRDVVIDIDARGSIVAVRSGSSPDGAERLRGAVACGMSNLHSHAFQRALAGHTGPAAPEGADSFWTWRTAMYRFLDRIDADAFEAIATQAYVEMAKAGYTSVAEFHYVHHDPAGRSYADPAELAWRIVAAARTAGVSLTLLPVFYAHGGFGAAPPAPGQRRFIHTLDGFRRLYVALDAGRERHGYVLGVAPHSLRAVTPDELTAILALPRTDAPVHIHAAEQLKEVQDCIAWSGQRPVEWLLDHAEVNRRWCIVHATHIAECERQRLARSGAVAGLAPTTEADLGDGIFPADEYLREQGRFGVGTDSNAVIDPFVELRQLEWAQRLRLHRRNVLTPASAPSLGAALWTEAARGGAQALAQAAGGIAPGRRADLVVLNDDDPALAAQAPERILDAAMFGPCRAPVRHVMIGGRWVVRDGRHVHEDDVYAAFRSTMMRLDAQPEGGGR
jgi:formimidoylglutamate deiminase